MQNKPNAYLIFLSQVEQNYCTAPPQQEYGLSFQTSRSSSTKPPAISSAAQACLPGPPPQRRTTLSSSNHSKYSHNDEFWKQPCAMNSYMYSLKVSLAARRRAGSLRAWRSTRPEKAGYLQSKSMQNN